MAAMRERKACYGETIDFDSHKEESRY